ncbi:ABC-type dipeptide/oligopeptide/nickel transport system ATPase subunit [Marinobacter persicus]|uniref:ABC-type dipeptide/oligopeptide/nickel transport system ATPase subunit n=1 Tax=Marinobacter persicus TaxID=930118 RepID=A0A2S6G4E0_9GAMM|nr:MAG: ABC transporter ATPase [Marinobacter sp. T13-3]PPK50636.1 ABC-type dipeptide/oligopeptide/nickel transport system ATPase subunit [Marinobacter persicus]PPK53974.1 ABC-type dipeptide/oligopeptide/nickel transport system ATPase subunit [Marinobacter persicus]PPK57145.1 ABC-type dipeptide/oligopeptide/nickel transport system ATPase subunit [Marinobacter persicus]
MTDLRLEEVSVGSLENVGLDVGAGEVVCLSGPSGSGKSRLLRAVADLEPHQGRVFLGDTEQASVPAHHWRKQVMLVPADSQWWFDEVGAHFPEACRQQVPEALGFAPEVMHWTISRLSSGERQRLALWRALALEPSALLLDEPTANLDHDLSLAVEEWLLAEIRTRQMPVLWVAHDRAQIQRVADRHLHIVGNTLEPIHGSD